MSNGIDGQTYWDILVYSTSFGLGGGAGWWVITSLLSFGRDKAEHKA